MQRLLRTAGWDVDGVRDDVRGYVLGTLGDPAGDVRSRDYATGHAQHTTPERVDGAVPPAHRA